MSFKYDYIPVEQLSNGGGQSILLAEGLAQFCIDNIYEHNKDGSPRTTMDGTPKITLALSCVDSANTKGIVYHDISAKMQWALVSLGKAIGRNVYNESGTTHWKGLIGARGTCVLENKETPPHKPKTVVKRYEARSEQKVVHAPHGDPRIQSADDEDLPF